jgi:hypothetical protein
VKRLRSGLLVFLRKQRGPTHVINSLAVIMIARLDLRRFMYIFLGLDIVHLYLRTTKLQRRVFPSEGRQESVRLQVHPTTLNGGGDRSQSDVDIYAGKQQKSKTFCLPDSCIEL